MKLLYMGDVHERMMPPCNRMDDWQATLDAKANEILSIAKRNNVTAILQGGDFNDTPKMPDEYQAKIIKRWSTTNVYDIVKKLVTKEATQDEIFDELKKGKPIISIAGNHDQFGSSMQGFEKTSLSFLSTVGLLNLVSKENPIILKDENSDFTVAITGSNYDLNIDKDAEHDAYIVKEKLADFHIHIVHGMLTNQNFGSLFAHTRVEDIKDTKADLTIAGHDHIGFDPVQIEGKWFVNPGAVIRLNNGEREMNREPRVMLIEITKEKGIQLKMKPLKSAKPADEVLSVEKKEAKKEMDERMERIKGAIEHVSQDAENKSVLDIVDEINVSTSFSEDMKNEVKDRIIEKMKKDKTKPIRNQPYYITKMILEDFQCHEYSEFEFDKRLNVIVGESDGGKSAIIRAFEFVFGEFNVSAKEFIRHGSKKAKVTLFLDNGIIIERIVEKKSNGFNGYRVFSPLDNQWIESNTKNLANIQDILGYNKMAIDEKNLVSINFLNQDDNHFFIGQNITPTLRAKIIGTVYKTHFADAVLRDLENEFKKSNTQLQAKKEDVKEYDLQIQCMTHVEPLKEKVDIIGSLLKEIDKKQEYLKNVKEAYNRYLAAEEKIKCLDTFLTKITPLIDGKPNLDTAISLVNKKEAVQSSYHRLQSIELKGARLAVYLKNIQNLLKKKEDVRDVIQSVNDFAKVKQTVANYLSCEKKIEGYGFYIEKVNPFIENKDTIIKTIEAITDKRRGIKHGNRALTTLNNGMVLRSYLEKVKPVITSSKAQCADIEKQIQTLLDVKNISIRINKINDAIKEEDIVINKASKDLNNALTSYKNYLKKVEICPVCLSKLSEDTIERMAKATERN